MRTKEQILIELEAAEAGARSLKKWLRENPEAPIHKIFMAKQDLRIALRNIIDLVCELNPLPPYPLNSKF